jgi:5-methylcytosine-specific restriction endonuclease McrA
MARTTPEWIGKTTDTPAPPRVRLRIFDRDQGACCNCLRKIYPGDKWACDHVKALINGGENRESNLQTLCDWCHSKKTVDDVRQKSLTYTKRSRYVGLKKKRTITRWRNMRGEIVEKPRDR